MSTIMQRYCYEEEHNMFREAFRTFLEREVIPHQETWCEQGYVDREAWLKAGENGFLVPQAPEELGGLGIEDFRYPQIVAEEMGLAGDSGFVMHLHSFIVAPFMLKFASDELKKKYIPGAVSGETILGVAMSEPDAGSDLAGMRSTAIDKGDHYLLNGSKTWISNGTIGDVFVVAARTNPEVPHAISLFAVEAGWEGFSRGKPLKKIGMKAQDTAELFFENVMIPKENLIGEEGQGFKYLMAGLAQERTICAIWNLGSAECAFKHTLEYVKERKAFGQTVGSFQNTQFKLASLRAKMDQAQCFVDTLVANINRGDMDAVAASEAKLLCSELQGEVVDECLQLHGGAGYIEEYKISKLYADARITRIFAGTSEIMKLIIARSLDL